MSGLEVVTLGCRLNLAESERIAALLGDERDLVVVNSCAVTGEAMRQSRRAVRQARARRPNACIVVSGCASEIDRTGFAALADVVVPNAAKIDAAAYAGLRPPDPVHPKLFDPDEVEGAARSLSGPPGSHCHTRAFVPVQMGCDHACTYCIIPQGRGPSRSRPKAEVVGEIAALAGQGIAEVVLTGVDLTAWGLDLAGVPRLGNLVAAILRECPALPRLRLSSLDGCEIDEALLDLLASEPRLMPHVHLSLQSGDDLILKRMKRRHRQAHAVALAERLRVARPDVAIGADFIAGFPTEDEAMHANSLAAIEDCGVVHGHVFPFSPRPGTPAARMPQVAVGRVRARAAELRAKVAEQRKRWLAALVGSTHDVLAERDGTGHAPNFARFRLPAGTPPGALVRLRAQRVEDGQLVGATA